MWRQKFIELLPEVNRRRLYEEKGFSSIFEFATKLCGLSAEQVRLALNLEKRFGDKPVLKKMLENGEVSINKLTRVVSIATPENEEELAAKIKVLPVSALNTLVRDEKAAIRLSGKISEKATAADKNQNGLLEPLFEDKGLYVQTLGASTIEKSAGLEFQLAPDVAQELNELNAKGIDVNELLRATLKKRTEEIAAKKEEITEKIQQTNSRYITVETRQLMKQEHGKKCSIAHCKKPAAEIHHSQRFSLSQNHDPRFLAPLCSDHHIIAHSIDLKYQKARADNFGRGF